MTAKKKRCVKYRVEGFVIRHDGTLADFATTDFDTEEKACAFLDGIDALLEALCELPAAEPLIASAVYRIVPLDADTEQPLPLNADGDLL